MRITLLCAALALSFCSFASAGPTEQLASILREASASSNPSVSFLEGIGKLGDADLNAAQVAAAVEAGAVSPALRPILDRVQRIRLSGDTVRFDFSSAFALNLGGRGYAHFDRQVSFQIDGRTLKRFRGFKLSQTAKGMKLAPRSIRFGSEGGVPIATVNMGIAGTHKISLAPQHAEAQGLTSRLRFG